MTTSTIRFYKETALPGTLQPNSVYFITSGSNYVEVYITNTAGAARRVINEADITTLIRAEITSAAEVKVVADIAARNALAPTKTTTCYVINATGDNTVASGGATYIYNTTSSSWVKISEAESLDLQLTWSALQGKPTSSVIDIDSAVSLKHTHANKTQLDQIGQNANGNLTYNGSLPYTGWESAGW